MSRVFIALFVLALIAPAAVAEQPAAEATAPAVSDSTQPVAPDSESPAQQDADEPAGDLFQDLDPARELEPRYICMSGCTTVEDCKLQQEPPGCPDACRLCDNQTGRACAGTCYCDI